MKAVFILKIYWKSHLFLLSLWSKSVKLHSGLKAVIFPHHEFSCLTILHPCPLCLVVALKFLSCVWLFVTPQTATCQASLSFTISQSLLKLMSIESMMPCNHIILSHPLLLLPSVFPSIRVFSKQFAFCIRWPKYYSFSISNSLSKEYWFPLGLTWFDLFAVQGTLKSPVQHHNLKASVLQHSASFMVQLSHLYMTTGKTIALTRRIFVSQALPGGLVVRIQHSHGRSPHGVLFPVREAFRLPLCLALFLILH